MLYAGKPYAPIYDLALKLAQGMRDKPVEKKRVLAIGDSVRTDFTGAATYGIDCLFVTAGIHSAEFGGREDPDPECGRAGIDRRRRQAARDCAEACLVESMSSSRKREPTGLSQLRFDTLRGEDRVRLQCFPLPPGRLPRSEDVVAARASDFPCRE